ncbi:MAG: TolC family protein [Myxococcales bacterium]
MHAGAAAARARAVAEHARATTESYSLGRAPLVSVLEAERARLDAKIALLEGKTMRANAWIDVERAMGMP